MKKELDDQLCKDFPLTFRDRHGGMHNTCMCWGFPDDGWEPILRKGAEKIEARIKELIAEGREKDGGVFTSSQVKEKFGTLNWYFTYSDPVINAAISEAEKASETVCERCGQEGKLRNGSWLLTLCDGCQDKNTARKARDYLFYQITRELEKKNETSALAHLEGWWKIFKNPEVKEDEQND